MAFKMIQMNVTLTSDFKRNHTFFQGRQGKLQTLASFFKIFDINNDQRVSENDLYDLMQLTSSDKIKSLQEKGKDIIPISDRAPDLFTDIFAGDFIKIIKKIEDCRKGKGFTDEDSIA